MLKRFLKNQKGLTLIELLAVVVILGIISAIAVPSVFKIIDNSKKDAHVANAIQMVNSTKLLIAGGDTTIRPTSGSVYIPLKYLLGTNGDLATMKDPDGGSYTATTDPTAPQTTAPAGSYVVVTVNTTTNDFDYAVKLVNDKPRGIRAAAGNLGGATAAGDAIPEASINRSLVQ